MGQRVITVSENSGGLVSSFAVHNGRIWTASGNYLCRLSADTTSWDKEILSPVPLKLLKVCNDLLYMTSSQDNNTALYMLDDVNDQVVQVCDSVGGFSTIDALHVLSDFKGAEWVDSLYAVYSERAAVARYGYNELQEWEILANQNVDRDHVISYVYNNTIYMAAYSMGIYNYFYKLTSMRGDWSRIAIGNGNGLDISNSLMVVHNDRLYLCDYWGELHRLREDDSIWEYFQYSPSGYYYPKNIISYAGYLFLVTGNNYSDFDNSTELHILKESGYIRSWGYGPGGLRSSVIYGGNLYYSSKISSYGDIIRYQSISSADISPNDVYNGEEPLSVNFSLYANGDFPITGYNLDFKDGTTYQGAVGTVTHEYLRGTYSPTLTVSDGYTQLTISRRDLIDVYDLSQVYQIYTIEDLQKIGSDGWPLHGNYVIMNDIDAYETASWNGGLGFIPRSNSSDGYNAFTGTLDGNNHTIRGLTINRPLELNVGIFGATNYCNIRNLTIENALVAGYYNVGVIAGNTSWDNSLSVIENCSIIGGSVSNNYSNGYLGGIVGRGYYTTFRNCYSSATLNTTSSYAVGGIVGALSGVALIDACVYENNSLRDLGTSSKVGGICGEIYFDKQLKGYVKNCTATANFIVRGQAGILCGYVNSGVIENCKVYGSIYVASGDHKGTFIGQCYTTDIENCHSYATMEISPDINVEYIGGFVGWWMGFSYCKNCTTLADIILGVGRSASYTGGFVGWSNTVDFDECHASGNIRAGGRGYTGGFVGQVSGGSFSYCTARGNVEVTGNGCYAVGGFGGYLSVSGNKLLCCYAKGNVTITCPGGSCTNIGGFIGYFYGSQGVPELVTEACYSKGNVSVEADSISAVGGLVGYNSSGDLYICEALGTVEGTTPTNNVTYLGGLCGYTYNSKLEKCYTRGNIKGTGNYIGGLVGYHGGGNIEICYASGSVEGYVYTGGFIGYHGGGSISDCYASGNVSSIVPDGSNTLGGFIGSSVGNIARVYSCGRITATMGNIGGLIGVCSNSGSITDSYWDTETSGLLISAGGTGLDSATMKTLAGYPDWDFSVIWLILEGYKYPYFRYPPPAGPVLHVEFDGNPLSGYVPLTSSFTDQSIW